MCSLEVCMILWLKMEMVQNGNVPTVGDDSMSLTYGLHLLFWNRSENPMQKDRL